VATTGRVTGGQAVTQALAAHGVDVVWGIPGTHNRTGAVVDDGATLVDALERGLASDRPTVLHVHEGNAQPIAATGGASA
jgi:thiamine pyrophosphate-dependent acetolactate synthase large subunit-like protein